MPAVTEAVYLLGFSLEAQAALLARLEEEAPRLLPLDRRDVPRIRELMHKYRERKMDLADAALVRVAERERISPVFAINRADFLVYRPLGSRPFTIIP